MHRMVNNPPYKKEGPERPCVLSVVPKRNFYPKSKNSVQKRLPLSSLVYNCSVLPLNFQRIPLLTMFVYSISTGRCRK